MTPAAAAVIGVLAGTALALLTPTVLRVLPAPDAPTRKAYQDLAVSSAVRRAVAAAAAAVCGLLALRLGWAPALPAWLVVGSVGALLSVIDARTRLLPAAVVNPAQVAVAAALLAAAVTTSDYSPLLRAAGGWAVAAGLFALTWLASPSSLGYGDVRLAALLGMALGWLGWAQLYVALLLALLLASLVSTVLLLRRRLGRRDLIPLGPFLVAGAVAAALLPAAVL